jgi:hypothetical protein
VADPDGWSDFGATGERGNFRPVEVSAENRGVFFSQKKSFFQKVRLCAVKAEKKIKKSLERIYICIYICIYQNGKKQPKPNTP